MASLATATQLATHVGATVDTARAQQALNIASAVVRSETGQTFEAGTSTVALPTPHGQWLTLPQRPVTAVTTITIDGLAVTDFTRYGNRLFRFAGWTASSITAPVVTVTYSHGGAVPDDVLGVVLAIAADVVENQRGLTSETETIDDYTYTWRASDTEQGSLASVELAQIIRAYRRRPLTVALA